MYPLPRLMWQFFIHRKSAPLGVTDTHVSHHYCLPWDLDMWWELNNGRTLTLYDMGRLPLAGRVGLIKALKSNGWGLTMAGCSVRYRRRVRMFDKIEMRSRAVCWDARFIYLEQSMWRGNECTSHILYRSAVTSRDGIVPTEQVIAAVDPDATSPKIPEWIANWSDADATRPWPPMPKVESGQGTDGG